MMRGAVGGTLALFLFGKAAMAQTSLAPVAQAHAPASTPVAVTAQAAGTRWYGAPILVGDGLAYGCFLVAVDQLSAAPIVPGGLAYMIVGPVTHAVHRNWRVLGLSLALRVFLPFVGMGIGSVVCGDHAGEACFGSVLAGGAVAMLGVTAIDVAVLAREPLPPPTATAWLTPVLTVRQGQALVGAAGAF